MMMIQPAGPRQVVTTVGKYIIDKNLSNVSRQARRLVVGGELNTSEKCKEVSQIHTKVIGC